MALSAYASYFEVQVPMSEKQTSTQMFGHQPLTTGHFGTTVHTLDQSGRAYTPGQSSSSSSGITGPRRVGGNDHSDEINPVPHGDTPWLFIGLLLLIYLVGSPKIFNFWGKRSVKRSVIQGQSPQSREQ